MEPEYLFVYGTLLSVFKHPVAVSVKSFLSLMGKASLNGRLYDVGSYPGAILMKEDASEVVGELYRVINPEKVFKILDSYEGISRVC